MMHPFIHDHPWCVRLCIVLEEVDFAMVKALNVFDGTDEQLLGSGGACRIEAFGNAGSKGKGKGHMQIDVDMTEIKWIEEGWAHGYKVFIGDLPGNIGKLDLAECTKGQVDLAINANATRSGMAYAIATFGDVAQAIDCYKAAMQLKFEHGPGNWHWACPKWFRFGKKAKGPQ
jgi:hypothetical protein